MTPMRWLPTVFLATLVTACTVAPTRDATSEAAVATVSPAHDNLNAVLWMQTAAEYEATVRGVYAAASGRLVAALADPGWNALPESERSEGFESLPPAIIVDADETMIDNSPFQARDVRDGHRFDYARWVAWVNERRARAMPGALEFARDAAERGVTIFFVSNRDTPGEAESTIANLRALGFPIAVDAGNVLMRGDARAPAREKSERRRWVGARYRVLLLLGDNLGDFMDGVGTTVVTRQELMAPYADWWGVRWFMQPNPAYGSWEAAVLLGCGESARSESTRCKRTLLRDK